MLSHIKVGDTLYDPAEPAPGRSQTRKPQLYYVHKVGKKYITAGYNPVYDESESALFIMVDKKTARVGKGLNAWNGFRVFESKEKYEEFAYRHVISEKIKNEFVSTYTTYVPDVSTEQLKQIAKILGIEE